MKKFILCLTAIVLILGLRSITHATPITYTFDGTGSGDLDGNQFTGAAFKITIEADTTQVVDRGDQVWYIPSLLATIDLDGFGIGTFLAGDLGVFNNQAVSAAGFWHTNAYDLLDVQNPGFATWDLITSFGPILDPSPFAVSQFSNELLDFGSLSFSDMAFVSFEATTAPVPEPATLLLLGSGLVGLVINRKRKKV